MVGIGQEETSHKGRTFRSGTDAKEQAEKVTDLADMGSCVSSNFELLDGRKKTEVLLSVTERY
jgi:hypothetical protein